MFGSTKRPPAQSRTVVETRREHQAGDSLLVGWVRVGAACGFVAGLSYALAAAAPVTSDLALVAAFLFGPALVGLSAGLYHVLRARRRTITLDLALMANIAAGVTVTLMFFTQLTLNRWFEMQFGSGSRDSSERALRTGFEAGNGIQLGLDVAWTRSLPWAPSSSRVEHVAPLTLRPCARCVWWRHCGSR